MADLMVPEKVRLMVVLLAKQSEQQSELPWGSLWA